MGIQTAIWGEAKSQLALAVFLTVIQILSLILKCTMGIQTLQKRVDGYSDSNLGRYAF